MYDTITNVVRKAVVDVRGLVRKGKRCRGHRRRWTTYRCQWCGRYSGR